MCMGIADQGFQQLYFFPYTMKYRVIYSRSYLEFFLSICREIILGNVTNMYD